MGKATGVVAKNKSLTLFRTLLGNMTVNDALARNVNTNILEKASLASLTKTTSTTEEVVETLSYYFHSENGDDFNFENIEDLLEIIGEKLGDKPNVRDIENLKTILGALYTFYAQNSSSPVLRPDEIEVRKNRILDSLFPSEKKEETVSYYDFSDDSLLVQDVSFTRAAAVTLEQLPSPSYQPALLQEDTPKKPTFKSLSESDNPLIMMLMRFIGKKYLNGGPRPEMLADFARYYQCLGRHESNYRNAMVTIPNIEFKNHAHKKGVKDYTTPRARLKNMMDDDEIKHVYKEFVQVLLTLQRLDDSKPEDKSLLDNLNRVNSTIKALEQPVDLAAAPRDLEKASTSFFKL